MGYKWKPSKSQRKAFAIKMQDSAEKAAYEERKKTKAEKRRADSQFDYESAGGEFVPTKYQHDKAFAFLRTNITIEQHQAINIVIAGYAMNEKVHHDYIHILNELIRSCLLLK